MMADGRLGKCKLCAKKDVQQNRKLRIEKYRQYDASRAMCPDRIAMRSEYMKTLAGKSARSRAHKKQRQKFPEKYRARTILSNCVRSGKIVRLPCEKCGNPRSHGHHEDYSKPLDVIWLCAKHHRDVHKAKKETT